MINLLTLLAAAPTAPVTQPFDPQSAGAYLREAVQACEGEAGRLWGVSLCGPILIVDPATRRAVSSQVMADTDQEREGAIFIGKLPDTVGLANTAITWKGQRWTLVQWPLPADAKDRTRLLMHEAWHRIQPELDLVSDERKQDHLATRDGRVSLRMELRALRTAILSQGAAADAAFRDAVFFRAWRYAKFPHAAADEAALETNEGLAEYTGWVAAGTISDRLRIAKHLESGDAAKSFSRSFAYFTGPAWGNLLDQRQPDWRSRIRTTRSLPITTTLSKPDVSSAMLARRGARYGFPSVLANESAIADARQRADTKWRALLIEGPILVIPMVGANIIFDPNDVHTLPEGNVYSRLEARGPWGTLVTSEGALVSNDWSTIRVSAAALKRSDASLNGAGWTLHTATGWRLESSTLPFRLTR